MNIKNLKLVKIGLLIGGAVMTLGATLVGEKVNDKVYVEKVAESLAKKVSEK